jgi:hypothetical protein
MPPDRLPFLRGRITRLERFRSPQAGGGKLHLPLRDAAQHREILIRDLDLVLAAVEQRSSVDAELKRAVVAVIPAEGHELDDNSLGDKRTDLRVVSTDPDTGVVLIDAGDPSLTALRRKLDQYVDPLKINKTTHLPKNAKSLAPIDHIVVAGQSELAGQRLLAAKDISKEQRLWFEVGCRGGTTHPAETEESRRQIRRALPSSGPGLLEFVAVEQTIFFLRASLDDLRRLVQATDCVYEFDLAAPSTRDWLYSNIQPVRDVTAFGLSAPPAEAPAVAILDTGIATAHPLLSAAIRRAVSVLPADASPEDGHEHGHGTGMAGVALYGGDLGDALDAGGFDATCWIESARILHRPHSGTGSEENREFWPGITRDAVLGLEREEETDRPRAFALAVSAELGDRPFSTSWSHSVDQLAHNDGKGRLICVAAGNANASDPELIRGYPSLNLAAHLHDPAQAMNAITVGAFTEKQELPKETIYLACAPVAPRGGISPYTRAGAVRGALNKPDIVMEGGNVAFDGSLPSAFVETLSTLTTHRDFLKKPLGLICMTSEAVARAARLAAEIWSVEPGLRPETIRGLIVHSATWTAEMEHQFPNIDERIAICGLGVPDREFALGCARDRATVLIEDLLANVAVNTDGSSARVVKFFALPTPDTLADLDPGVEVELRVTLSYLAEPLTFRQRTSPGLDLRWEMQGSAESPTQFFKRINMNARSPKETIDSRGFPWSIGPRRRSKGTVQSDRYRGSPSLFAGQKYIAVLPVLGWWDRRPEYRLKEQRFSLIVTLQAEGSEIYSAIAMGIEVVSEVSVTV